MVHLISVFLGLNLCVRGGLPLPAAEVSFTLSPTAIGAPNTPQRCQSHHSFSHSLIRHGSYWVGLAGGFPLVGGKHGGGDFVPGQTPPTHFSGNPPTHNQPSVHPAQNQPNLAQPLKIYSAFVNSPSWADPRGSGPNPPTHSQKPVGHTGVK